MEDYVVLIRRTVAGNKAIATEIRAVGRLQELASSVECEILYARNTLGEYDLVLLVSAPSAEKMARFSLLLGTTGSYRTLTLPCVTDAALLGAVRELQKL
jgi:uncharacterized protein with GYD domain